MNSSLFMDMELSYNYESGSSIESSNGKQTTSMLVHDDIFNPTWESIFVQQNNNPCLISRKRSAEVLDDHTKQITNRGFSLSATNEEKQTRFGEPLPKIQKQKVGTGRKSQKLTDKITALQKLVSPYGKTDTSSVLLEASISIKALQDQIKNSFDMLSRESHLNMGGRKRYNLQSMGLCLVPSSISEKLVGEFSHNVYSSVSVTTLNL